MLSSLLMEGNFCIDVIMLSHRSKEKPEEKIKSDQEIARLQKLLVEKDELIKKVEKEKSEIEQESNQVIAEMADRYMVLGAWRWSLFHKYFLD